MPEGETVVFSAHGVSPARARERRGAAASSTIDATCPLVTKVHVEAKKFAAEGYTIVLIGHEGHEEVEGTMGEAPDHFVLVETEEDVDNLEVPDPDRVAFLTQTTLSRRRDRPHHPPAARALPEHHRAEVRRHLLRHHQPPDGRAPDGARVRPRARDRLAQLVELEPAGRGRARPRRRVAPDRQRDPGARGVARGQARRGHHAPARARPRSSSSAWSTSSARAAPARSRSSRSSRRTSASCCRRRSGRRWRRGRELHAVQAEAGRLGLDRPVHLVEPGLPSPPLGQHGVRRARR